MEERIKYFSMSTETKPASNTDTTLHIKEYEQRTSYPPENRHTKLQFQGHQCSRNGSRPGGVETDYCIRSSSLIFWGDSCGGVGEAESRRYDSSTIN